MSEPTNAAHQTLCREQCASEKNGLKLWLLSLNGDKGEASFLSKFKTMVAFFPTGYEYCMLEKKMR